MGVYWTVLACSVLFWWLIKLLGYNEKFYIETQDTDNKSMIGYFVLMATLMITMIGLRSEFIGIDTPRYYDTYLRMETQEFSYLFTSDVREKLFSFLQILCNKLHLNFYAFNVIYAMFNIGIVSCLIYKKSAAPWFSYILYICFGFFILDFTMLRQTYAMSVVILAVLIDKNKGIKDFLLFALLIYLASLFHASAIICLPLWFVRKIPFKPKAVAIFLVFMLVSYLLRNQLSKLAFDLMGEFYDKYERYSQDMQSGNYGTNLYLMMLVTVLFSLFFNKHLTIPFNRFMFYCMCIMLIVFPIVQNTGGASMRIYYYFYIFMVVYIPNMLNSLDKKKDFLPFWGIVALYVLVGISVYAGELATNSYMIVPYKFFWQ